MSPIDAAFSSRAERVNAGKGRHSVPGAEISALWRRLDNAQSPTAVPRTDHGLTTLCINMTSFEYLEESAESQGILAVAFDR